MHACQAVLLESDQDLKCHRQDQIALLLQDYSFLIFDLVGDPLVAFARTVPYSYGLQPAEVAALGQGWLARKPIHNTGRDRSDDS